MNGNGVLTDDHLQRINDSLAGLDKAAEHMRLAKLAGLDVSQMEAAANEARDKLQRIKQVYFPGR